jgi:hypothetical protein
VPEQRVEVVGVPGALPARGEVGRFSMIHGRTIDAAGRTLPAQASEGGRA